MMQKRWFNHIDNLHLTLHMLVAAIFSRATTQQVGMQIVVT